MRLIDADTLFNWGKYKLTDAVKYGNKGAEQQHFSYSTLMMYEIADEIDDAPTIDAVPVVRGEWVRMDETQALLSVEWKCSQCGQEIRVDGILTAIGAGWKYCPNCGARMDGEE